MKTLFLVQSNFGQGHHSRVNAFAENIYFKYIITQPFTGRGSEKEYFDNEFNNIYKEFKDYKPDIVVTEGFPFGRYGWHPHFNKEMKHDGILEILREAKKLYSLDRDIPWVDPRDYWFHAEILNEYYDGILFHTDNNFINPKTFINNPILDIPFISTGYVCDTFKFETERKGILAYCGDWYPHTETIYHMLLQLKDDVTFVVGKNTPRHLKERMTNIIERTDVNNFREQLFRHEVFVGNFGAGTFLDVNMTETPAVMIPNPIHENSTPIYDTKGNIIDREESYRAKRYEEFDFGRTIMYDDLTTDKLEHVIEESRKLKPKQFDMNGKSFIKNIFNGESDV